MNFCPKCGKKLTEASAFCPSCGNPLSVPRNASSTDAPHTSKPSCNTVSKSQRLKKNQYLQFDAPENIKKLANSVYLVFAIVAILSILCLHSALTTPFYKLNFCQIAITEDIELIKHGINEDRHRFEKNIDRVPHSQRGAVIAFYENPSIQNASNFLKAAGDSSSSLAKLFSVAKFLLWFATIVIICFAFLATYRKSSVIASFSAFFVSLFAIMFSTPLLILFSVASAITLAVICSKINNAYKSQVTS